MLFLILLTAHELLESISVYVLPQLEIHLVIISSDFFSQSLIPYLSGLQITC